MKLERIYKAFSRCCLVLAFFAITGCSLEKVGCNTTGVLNIESFSDRGEMVVGLREGVRPGSKLIDAGNMVVGGKLTFSKICPGTYFFSFGKPESETVFVTDYYNVQPNTKSFQITVRVVKGSSLNPPERINSNAM